MPVRSKEQRQVSSPLKNNVSVFVWHALMSVMVMDYDGTFLKNCVFVSLFCVQHTLVCISTDKIASIAGSYAAKTF